MRHLHYIEIKNFKAFADTQRIELDHPAVIIGPNNCGKTSVIQALSLWSLAVKTWYEVRKNTKAKERISAPLNRLNIFSVPVQRTRFFWHEAKVRMGGQGNIALVISVGVVFKDKVCPVSMRFRNDGEDIVYCTPEEDCRNDSELIEYVASIDVNLLYCMSGLETDEAVLKPNRIDMLLGKGQTAQVLRNLCLMVYQNSPRDWDEIVGLLERLFRIKMGFPVENSRGAIDLFYTQESGKEPFEIASSGRGFQQMLLVFAYLFSHKRSVLLIDEPDAHLEILRQKQVFVLIRDIASRNNSQAIMVTHSEVVLEEALETNLILLLEGKADNLAKKIGIRENLKLFGSQHYIRARQRGYVLYIEGGTDIDILRAFAEKYNHPVMEVWDERLNSFYIQNNYPEQSTEMELERVEGGFGLSPKQHFDGLRKILPGLQGLAILDNDGHTRQDRDEENLKIRYWKRYEIENYFITPELLIMFVEGQHDELGLFAPGRNSAQEVLDQIILESVFNDNHEDFQTWKQSPHDAARLIWDTKSQYIKMSSLAENFFNRLSEKIGISILINKGEFHRLVQNIKAPTIQPEIDEKLNLLAALFRNSKPIDSGT
ncbi:MAG: AAA family ATPase [Chitinivibrionales bacterium]|nr:AAA family ATPase [Chitinivibrionales bacterium]